MRPAVQSGDLQRQLTIAGAGYELIPRIPDHKCRVTLLAPAIRLKRVTLTLAERVGKAALPYRGGASLFIDMHRYASPDHPDGLITTMVKEIAAMNGTNG